MLDAALRPAARVPDRGRARVDAYAAAAVLGLVELAVDDALEHDENDAEEHREERDADVGLQVPLLEAEVLAEEGVGLSEEARGAPRGGRRVHRRASCCCCRLLKTELDKY